MRAVVTSAIVAFMACLAAGLVVNGLSRTRGRAERVRCQEHLRRIGQLYLVEEAQRTGAFPSGTVFSDRLPPEKRLSWLVPGLTRLGHEDAARWINNAAAWNEYGNDLAGKVFLPQSVCPAATVVLEGGAKPLHYPGIAGVWPEAATKTADALGAGIFRYDTPTLVSDVKDGMSNVLMLLEAPEKPGMWIAGGPDTVRPLDPARAPYIGPGRSFGGSHVGGANAAFADGSVRFLDESINTRVLEMLAGIADSAHADSQ
jgi:prepilin-type processing-associated H-X9-DG protein